MADQENVQAKSSSKVRIDFSKPFEVNGTNFCSRMENLLGPRPKLADIAKCAAKLIFSDRELMKYCFGSRYNRANDRPSYPDEEKLDTWKKLLRHVVINLTHEQLRTCFNAVNSIGRMRKAEKNRKRTIAELRNQLKELKEGTSRKKNTQECISESEISDC